MGHNCLEIAKALQINHTLIDIGLALCGIKIDVFNSFITMLKFNKCLKIIDLDLNDTIEDSNFKLLCDSLMLNKTLKSIYFNRFEIHSICDDNIKLLINVLKENKTLQSLNMKDNKVSNEMAETLVSLLTRKPTLSIDFTCDSPIRRSLLKFYNRHNELNRNKLEWSKIANQIIDICIALQSLNLPPYVLLEIIDWLPLFEYVDHKKKIDLIINVKKSISKIVENKK